MSLAEQIETLLAAANDGDEARATLLAAADTLRELIALQRDEEADATVAATTTPPTTTTTTTVTRVAKRALDGAAPVSAARRPVLARLRRPLGTAARLVRIGATVGEARDDLGHDDHQRDRDNDNNNGADNSDNRVADDEADAAPLPLVAKPAPAETSGRAPPPPPPPVHDARMHEHNLYRERPPDFAALAAADERFARHVRIKPSGAAHLDWADATAVRELARAMLRHDFGVRVELPADALCPTVPLRLNYLLWLHDLLGRPRGGGGGAVVSDVCGVDVGTGASGVYALLGRALYGWRFVGTELQPAWVRAARHQVELNGWQDAIRIVQSPRPDALLVGVIPDGEQFDFCMCNPPFFESDEHKQSSHNPRSAYCAPDAFHADGHGEGDGGGDGEGDGEGDGDGDGDGDADAGGANAAPPVATEYHTAGGEVEFLMHMVDDSMALRQRIRWYTSMVGRQASLKPLRARLLELGVRTITTTTFYQGRTARWALAWTLCVEALSPYCLVPQARQARSATRSGAATVTVAARPDTVSFQADGRDAPALLLGRLAEALRGPRLCWRVDSVSTPRLTLAASAPPTAPPHWPQPCAPADTLRQSHVAAGWPCASLAVQLQVHEGGLVELVVLGGQRAAASLEPLLQVLQQAVRGT